MQEHMDSLAISYQQEKKKAAIPDAGRNHVSAGTWSRGALRLFLYHQTIKAAEYEKAQREPEDKAIHEIQYDGWLNKYNPYYAALTRN